MIKKTIFLILLSFLLLSCPEGGLPKWPEEEKDQEEEPELDNDRPEQVSAPVFSYSPGNLKALAAVEISCSTSGAAIYFTTDGNTPTNASERYDTDSPPRLFADTTFKALAVKSDMVSAVTTAEYKMTPYYEDVSFDIVSGMKWSFTHTHSHHVSYSYFGDSSFTSSLDFDIITGEETEIEGLPAYELIVSGGFSLDWKYLATDGYRLYASDDGTSLSVLFDAEYGFWIGRGFFADFSSEDSLLSVGTVLNDTYEVSTSWSYSDDDTAYYPGYGTIYDPDALTMNSSLEESYKNGVGPCYYKKYSSIYDYYEAKSDTYTITFNELETGIDISFFTTDFTVTDEQAVTVFSSQESCRVKVEISDNYANYFYFIESPEGSNPVVSAYSYKENFEPFFENQDSLTSVYESGFIKNPRGDVLLDISGISSPGGSIKIHLFKEGTSVSTGQYYSTFSIIRTVMLGDGEVNESYLDGSSYYNRLFRQDGDFSGSCYFYAIPLSSNLNLRLALMEEVPIDGFNYSFTGDEFSRYIDENGPGQPESFTWYDNDFTMQVWEDADDDGSSEESGNFIFGWGSY